MAADRSESLRVAVSRSSRGLLAAAEPWRAGLEFAALGISTLPLALAPRGDGHRVLVLPGLGASDASTVVLRRYLQFLGYESLPWELGRNLGFNRCWPALQERFLDLLEAAAADGREVSVVGQSLGGTMAVRLALQHGTQVRSVITLGSPVPAAPADSALAVRNVYRRWNDDSARMTNIFSRTDGVVPWQVARRDGGDVEAIEVHGSHFGMALNAGVLYAVADRLAAVDGRTFKAPLLLQGYFP